MLSVCITVKNRSRIRHEGRELELFPACVASIRRCAEQLGLPRMELVVADWDSDDWPLAEWIESASGPLPLKLVRAAGGFNRGRGLNLAASASQGELLFFLDADCVVDTEVVTRGSSIASRGEAYFPIMYSFDDPGRETGRWRKRSYGNCMLPRSVFEASGAWPEFNAWGGEDLLFWSRVTARAGAVREQAPGLLHQWHPDDLAWKNRYGERALVEQERSEGLASTIREQTPEGATLLLVREAWHRLDGFGQRVVLPFLERNGIYWGPPRDDEQAVGEIERMRQLGAGFIAFSWECFWWLEHYVGFGRHLRRTYTCIREDANVVIFDVRGTK